MKLVKASLVDDKPDECFRLSVSKSKTFKSCKAKYNFSYIQKLPKKEWEHLNFGLFLHEVLEYFHKERLAGNTEPDNVLISKVSKIAYETYGKKLSPTDLKEAKDIIFQYLQILDNERIKGYPDKVTHAEKDFKILINDKVLLIGYIDRIQKDADGLVHVADYKTSKSDKYLKNDFFQLKTYAYALCLEDESIEEVRTSYIMLRDNFKYITKTFKRSDIMKVGNKFAEDYELIKNEKIYRPSVSPLCKWCDFIDSCDDGKRHLGIVSNNYGERDW